MPEARLQKRDVHLAVEEVTAHAQAPTADLPVDIIGCLQDPALPNRRYKRDNSQGRCPGRKLNLVRDQLRLGFIYGSRRDRNRIPGSDDLLRQVKIGTEYLTFAIL